MSTNTALKPCPFCGSQPIRERIEPHTHPISFMPDYPGAWLINCGTCEFYLFSHKSIADVESKWNTRTQVAGLVPELATDNTTVAVRDVISERQRQHDQGRGDAHDDGYIDGVLSLGGAAYAISGAGFNEVGTYRRRAKNLWPFPLETFNPAGNMNRRADLVRAAAMIIAEVDKIDRKSARTECAATSPRNQDVNAGWMQKLPPGKSE